MSDVKKINGYNIKDASARTTLTMYGHAMDTMNTNIGTIQHNYLDLTKVEEVKVTITPTDTSPTYVEVNFPEGYNPVNSICLYKYIEYNTTAGRVYQRRVDENNLGVTFITDETTDVMRTYIAFILTGNANQQYDVTIGLIKMPEPIEE